MSFFDNSFTAVIPTTLLGLLGLLFAYLYGFYRNKDDKKLEKLKAVRSADRSKVIEMMLNDLGVQIDTSTLNSKQKYDLVVRLLNAKTRKYLIISITAVILSLIVAFLINNNYKKDFQNKTDGGAQKDSLVEKEHDPKVKDSVSASSQNSAKDSLSEKEHNTKENSVSASSGNGSENAATELNSNVKPLGQEAAKTKPKKKVNPPKIYTLFIFCSELKDTEVWLDDSYIGSIVFENSRGTISNVTQGDHVIQFRNYTVNKKNISYNTYTDKFGGFTDNKITVWEDTSYKLYLDYYPEENSKKLFYTALKEN